MAQEMVQISKKEYEALKKKAEENDELLRSFVRGLEDIKAGRLIPWSEITSRFHHDNEEAKP